MEELTTPEDALNQLRGDDDVCGCGKPLVPVLDSEGKRIGVTHTIEDDEHHMDFWMSVRVRIPGDDGN